MKLHDIAIHRDTILTHVLRCVSYYEFFDNTQPKLKMQTKSQKSEISRESQFKLNLLYKNHKRVKSGEKHIIPTLVSLYRCEGLVRYPPF